MARQPRDRHRQGRDGQRLQQSEAGLVHSQSLRSDAAGGSLYGLNNSNPFNPFYNEITTGAGLGTGVGQNPGGIITFGGGVALYSNGQVIGGWV